MATETQTQVDVHQLKQALIKDNDNDIKYNAIEIPANSPRIIFENFIPYNNRLVPDEKLGEICQFALERNPALNLWREHYMISFIICVVFTFSTIIQCWFILHGPSPYRHISLGFLLLAQLLSILWSFAALYGMYDMGKINKCVFIFGIISLFCLFPIIPVTVCTMIHFVEIKYENNDDRDFEQSTLWIKCIICLFVGIFQTLPQIIILIAMFSIDGYQLNTDPTEVINWSFLSSVLAMLAFCIVFASIYEETIIYILSIVWLCLDYAIYLFILSALFYDNNALIMFIIDLSVISIPWLFIPISWGYYFLLQKEVSSLFWFFSILSCIECSVIIFLPLILLTFGPWTLFCFLSQILFCNFLPFCMNLLEPINHSSDWMSYWYKYRIFKWIKKGHNREEKDIRLCCVNMIILDNYYENQFNALKHDMVENIKSSNFAAASRRLIIKKDEIPKVWKLREFYGTEWNIMYYVKLYTVCRIIHMVMPIIIAVYIGYKENWKIGNINFIIKYLGFTTGILYFLLIISVFLVWKSIYYHRMIIPFIEEFSDFSLKNNTPIIANCYIIMCTSKVLTDWIGNKDIAHIILQYALSIRIDDNT